MSFFFQAEDGIRDLVRSRGLGDVYKRQAVNGVDRSKFTRHDNLRLASGEAPVALIARPLAADGSDLPLVLSLIHI